MMRIPWLLTMLSPVLVFLSLPAGAATVPFTEDFNIDDSGWRDITNGVTSLAHEPTGGQDGGGFVSTSINFVDFEMGAQGPVLFRGPESASGGAFAGNWLVEGIGEFSAWVRHDSEVPLNFFARFASPFNFPGATAVQFAPVIGIPGPAGWTELVFAIDPNNPQFVTFEGSSFEAVFSNVGIVQVGVSVPDALAGIDAEIRVELDTVGIDTPEPAVALLLAPALMLLTGARRRS